MKKRMKIISWSVTISLMMMCIFSQCFNLKALATNQIKLIVNGKNITSSILPIVQNDNILVPIGTIAKELGTNVDWNSKNKTLKIKKDDTLVSLKINSHLMLYQNKQKIYTLNNIPPKLLHNHVFVSLDLCKNILGVEVKQNEKDKNVYIDSNKKVDTKPFFDIKISSIKNGQTITGKTNLQISLPNDSKLKNGNEIKYLLLDPNTAKGVVIARGNNLTDTYTWIPNLKEKGEKVLVAAIYNQNGIFIGGDAALVRINVVPKVSLTGVEKDKIIDNTIQLGTDANFVASYVKYEITNLDTGKKTLTTESDPQGSYKWSPMVENNGKYLFKTTAYDSDNKPYSSKTITAKAEIPRRLSLSGVADGETIDKPVTLSTSRNFQVSETEYVLKDLNTGKEESLKKFGYGNYKWFPELKYSGSKQLLVRVKDTRGKVHESKGINVNIIGSPKLLLEGIGPKQVLTKPVQLKSTSNVTLDSIDYIMTRPNTGEKKIIASKQNLSDVCTYKPIQNDTGDWNIKAIGTYKGSKIESEEIPIKVYLGEIYDSAPVIEKDKFKELASNLAKNSWEKTGMSAALQTAQAILESGWGQSVSVDKYTGKISFNLFGIKGEGTAGSVISNTCEEYNGKTFRVDAKFRAYNNVSESWTDHKNFLLNKKRYECFKEVMHDYTQGAWALKRAGYATDSQYPLKLMRIIKQYNLQELDKISI